jgi:hypothetical protein
MKDMVLFVKIPLAEVQGMGYFFKIRVHKVIRAPVPAPHET